MSKRLLNLRAILIFSFLTSVFLLALTKTHDVDAWIHLTMGRLIWTLKGFPEREPFLYTIPNNPFEYSSWLFGVIYYLAYKLFDTYGVIILKASTITLAFYILLRDSLLISQGEDVKEKKTNIHLFIAITVLSITAILTRPRFVERPDTFLMVFLPFSIYAINAYLYQGKRYIYILPIIHCLWANSHSSINLMFVPFGAAILSLGVNKLIKGSNGSNGSIKLLLIILVLSFGAALVSPYFINQFIFPIKFLKTEAFKTTISELKPPTWHSEPEFFILSIVVGISLILRIGVSIFKNSFPLQVIINAILVVTFFYLGKTSSRFIYVFAVVSSPILVKNITSLIDELNLLNKFGTGRFRGYALALASIVMIAWMVFYTSCAIQKKWAFRKTYQEFGFGFRYDMVPEKALRFMDKNGIYGRVLNHFSWGQYITWRDFPKRQASIDGRGSVGEELFILHTVGIRYHQPVYLPRLYEMYGFESILIKVPHWTEDRRKFNLSNDWAIVYWDELAMLFLKRGGIYDHVIKKREYNFHEVKTRLGETW